MSHKLKIYGIFYKLFRDSFYKKENIIMQIYNLDDPSDLFNDFEDVFNRIEIFYDFSNVKTLTSKVSYSPHYWLSEHVEVLFNKNIPKIKSLTKDLYSIIEQLFALNNINFDINVLESKYYNFKYLRLLNNKFKHSKINNNIQLIYIANLIPSTIDFYINYYNKKTNISEYMINFTELIIVFFTILEDYELIKNDNNVIQTLFLK